MSNLTWTFQNEGIPIGKQQSWDLQKHRKIIRERRAVKDHVIKDERYMKYVWASSKLLSNLLRVYDGILRQSCGIVEIDEIPNDLTAQAFGNFELVST